MAESSTQAQLARADSQGVVVSCVACGQRNRLPFAHVTAKAQCGKCQTPLDPPGIPVEVAEAAFFDAMVQHSSVPVVVDFWAQWCGPCRMVAPEIARLASRNAGRYVVAKVDTDAVPELATRLGIRSIPTMAVFADGAERARTAGARPAAEIEAFIQSALARR